jgi:hypothetical protein
MVNIPENRRMQSVHIPEERQKKDFSSGPFTTPTIVDKFFEIFQGKSIVQHTGVPGREISHQQAANEYGSALRETSEALKQIGAPYSDSRAIEAEHG